MSSGKESVAKGAAKLVCTEEGWPREKSWPLLGPVHKNLAPPLPTLRP